MTIQKLKLTLKQLNQLVNGQIYNDRFKVTFDDIPMYHPDNVMDSSERHTDYEDDGRKYHWYIFNDTVTNTEHCINYVYHYEFPNEILDTPDSIQIVDKEEDSSLYEKPVLVEEEEPKLTAEQKADKDLMDEYLSIKDECKIVEKKEKLKIPSATIKELITFLKEGKFSLFQLRAKVIPLCIKYRLEEQSFWQWIQVKRGVWK